MSSGLSIAFLAGAIVMSSAISANAAPPVGLGSTSNFAVLAGSGITNAGTTIVTGTAGADMGSAPTGSYSDAGSLSTTGTIYQAAEQIVTDAKTDLTTAYNTAASATPSDAVNYSTLSGRTLVGGVYNATSSMDLTGTLTLDGQDNPDSVWIFQAGSTLITASGSSVVLTNGARACNVFWQVGSSATFGTTTSFVGHVFADISISANTGATFDGQLLARSGAVTLQANTITNNVCAAAPSASASATPTPSDSSSATPTPSDSSSATPTPVETTETGGQLPHTEASWQSPFYIGLGFVALSVALFTLRRRRS